METPASLLEAVPALPASLRDASCDTGRQIARRAEQIASGQYNDFAKSSEAAAPTASAVTDTQADAITKLTDEALVQCLFDVSLMRESVVEPGKRRIQEAADALEAEFYKKDAGCGSGIGMDVTCHKQVVTDYKNRMAALAKNALRDLRTPFGEWQKKAGHCIGLRENAVSEVLSSGSLFATQALAMRTQTYSIPQVLGDGYAELCETAVTAGQRLDNQ
ncbi:MAG: hypothetical protein GC149_01855 [Gammaproteobacteria bacterium]|nr:hypothetical protein [Gammaproteobacteria bacterium]